MADFLQIKQDEDTNQLNSLVNPEQGAIQTPFQDDTNIYREQYQETHQPYSNGVIFKEAVQHAFEDTTIG